jgi:serine phosphatase RsbU (regulator of sigma subunit)
MYTVRPLACLLLLLTPLLPCRAQNQHYIDSLMGVINTTKDDSIKVAAWNNIGQEYIFVPKKALETAEKMLDLSMIINDQRVKALCIRKAGNIYYKHLNYEKAVNCYMKSINLYEKSNDKVGLANCYNNLGNIYTSKGKLTNSMPDFDQAINYHTMSLNLRMEINDVDNICNSYNNIGNAYSGKGDLEKALDYFFLAFKDYKAHKDNNGIDMVTMNLGDTHLAIAEKTGKAEEFGKALEYYLDRVRAYKTYGPTSNHASVLSRIGKIYMIQGDLGQSLKYLNDANTIANKVHSIEIRMDVAELLAQAYGKSGDYKKAFENYTIYNSLKDSVINEKTAGNIAQMQTMYETAQKDKEIDLLNKDKALNESELEKGRAESERQRILIFASIGALVFVFGLALLLYNRNNIRKKANKELSAAYKKVEQANKQVTDSINYAKRIQDAILVPESDARNLLADFFVFFRPRDIVSGDFYWFSHHKNKTFFAVADCTGHGVPGAFMSMIGNTLLNEIVNHKNILEPGKILEALHDGVTHALHQDNKSDLLSQDDGMDISICVIDGSTGTISFAGANHSMYVVSNGTTTTIKGDIHSIGGSLGKTKRSFTSQTITAPAGSRIFMSTDGFYDQFGGEKGSKFLTTRFEKLITEAASGDARNIIEKAFLGWKGNNEQIDDVLVAGFKV